MPSLPTTTAGEGGLYFSFRPSRLNVSPSETKIEPDRRLKGYWKMEPVLGAATRHNFNVGF